MTCHASAQLQYWSCLSIRMWSTEREMLLALSPPPPPDGLVLWCENSSKMVMSHACLDYTVLWREPHKGGEGMRSQDTSVQEEGHDKQRTLSPTDCWWVLGSNWTRAKVNARTCELVCVCRCATHSGANETAVSGTRAHGVPRICICRDWANKARDSPKRAPCEGTHRPGSPRPATLVLHVTR